MKRSVSGTMLMLLLITMLSLSFNLKSTKAEWTGTVYIRSDGSIDPPDAPITTDDYVTYTLTGNIKSTADGIVVERDNIVIDGNGYILNGSNTVPYMGVRIYGRYNVIIKNLGIQNFFYSVYLYNSSNNSIIGNNITNNMWSIYLYRSSNNSIIGNNITKNLDGIYLHQSSNNNIVGNNITTNNFDGIYLFQSSNNSIVGNNITMNNYFGIGLWGSSYNSIRGNSFVNDGLYILEYSYGNVVVDNLVNGKPLIYLEGISGYTIRDAGQVILINCSDILVENLNLSHTDVGVQLWMTENTTIAGNNITNNLNSIYLHQSSNNSIVGNDISNNLAGVYLHQSSNNSIAGNDITTNNYFGISFLWSSSNSISGNSITNNSWGIGLSESSSNSIHHNNFINNTSHVYSYYSFNTWDDGYPSGGNYWSDYTGVDFYSGPYQNETGSDGIGDTPYVIDENNVDHYPLMNPWTPKPPVITATVDIQPQALNLKSRGKWITTYIELPEGYNVADINRTTILLNGTIPVDPFWISKPIKSVIGDYDNDTIPDLMVKFDRQQVINYIMANVDMSRLYEERFMTITLTVTGKLKNGTPFQGSDTVKIILLMPRGIYKIFPI
jgi:parallel beta-helix repeat protein